METFKNALGMTVAALTLTFVVIMANAGENRSIFTTPAFANDADDTTLRLAGALVVYAKKCEREFNALTPLQQDAVRVYVKRDAMNVYGTEAVANATVNAYNDGYYTLGQRWCSIGDSLARSMASAMTRK
jgi:hypothetical protein